MCKPRCINTLLEICVESKKNPVERDLTEAERCRGQWAGGRAAGLRGSARVALPSWQKQ